jgi:hypothetical protein
MLARSMTASRSQVGAIRVVDDQSGRAQRVRETNQMVFVWHGSDEPEFEIAPIAELNAPNWRPLRWRKLRPFATTLENVKRDVVDDHHFGPVHGVHDAHTRASIQGPFFDTVTEGLIDTSRFAGPRLLAHLRLDGRLHGLGLLVYHMTVTMGIQLRFVTLSTATPIDAAHTRMYIALCMQRAPLGPLAGLVEPLVFKNFALNFEHDRIHWETPKGRFDPDVRLPAEAELLEVFERWAAGFSPKQAAFTDRELSAHATVGK